MWINECDAANDYFSYLEDMLVVNKISFVTIKRYKICSTMIIITF
jgi:hypothetical protein